jgi:hypothetical protein
VGDSDRTIRRPARAWNVGFPVLGRFDEVRSLSGALDPLRRAWNRYARALPYLKWMLFAIGAIYCVGVLAGWFPYNGQSLGLMTMADGYAYWSAAPADPYSGTLGDLHAYLYSPVFLQGFAPLQVLPWPVFAWVWFGLHVAVLWKLRALWMLALPFVADDVLRGNVHTFYALALVFPLWMVLPLVTKITPGVVLIGMRDWRGLWVALLACAISVILAPHLWVQWIEVLQASAAQQQVIGFPYPLIARLPFAVALAFLGRRRPWLLPIAMLLAMPQIWPASFAVLVALPMLLRRPDAATTAQ